MKFRNFFNIGHRQVGGGADCLVIAEAGVSHFGDMGIARELVDMAAEAEADVFKTQIFDVDHLLSDQAMEWKNRLRARNLNFDQIEELKNRCESQGLIFMTTAHDESRINWLERDLNDLRKWNQISRSNGTKGGCGYRNNWSGYRYLQAMVFMLRRSGQ